MRRETQKNVVVEQESRDPRNERAAQHAWQSQDSLGRWLLLKARFVCHAGLGNKLHK